MEREIIVVTAAYGNDKIKALGGQRSVLPIIAEAGADGVEIRRELLDPAELDTLPALAQAIARHQLTACYSAPEPLFEHDGKINARLPALLAEAHELNARWLKLSLGHFSHAHQAEPLAGLLALSDVALVVENDQTACGRLEPMRRFLAASKTLNLPIRLTFDMANWLWVDDVPEDAARALRAGVSYIHVKAATAHHYHYRAIALDDADARWRTLLEMLPSDAPRGIEFPLEGRDLTAVTRHYVNLLREE